MVDVGVAAARLVLLGQESKPGLMELLGSPDEFSESQWQALSWEGLQGMVAYAALASGEPGWTEAVGSRYLESAALEVQWKELVREISRKFAAGGLRAIAFKGATAIHGLYPALGLRPLSDIDLLVRAEDRNHTLHLLKTLGFEAYPETPWVLSRELWRLDLHLSPIGQWHSHFLIDLEEAWATAHPLFQDCRGMWRLSAEFELLFALMHATKHGFERLIWLVDILLMLQNARVQRVSPFLQRTKAQRWLAYSLWLIERHFQVRFPDWAVHQRQMNRFEQRFLQGCMARNTPHPMGMIILALSTRNPLHGVLYLLRALSAEPGSVFQRCLQVFRLADIAWGFMLQPPDSFTQ